MGGDAEVLQREGDAAGPEEVDLDRAVERRVERDGRRRVDDDVAGGERDPAGLVQTEAFGADVAGDDLDPPVDGRVERVLAQVGTQAVEGVVVEDLALGPLRDGRSLAGADEQHELAAWHRAHQPLDQRGAEEAGATGDGDALAVESLGDHRVLSTIW
jgi:hypothetical protein